MAFLTSQSWQKFKSLYLGGCPEQGFQPDQGCFAVNLYISRSLVPSVAQANITGKTIKNEKNTKTMKN